MLSLAAQWVDEELQQHQVLLCCQELSRSHTAANLTATFDTMLQQWEIDNIRVHVSGGVRQ